MKTKLSACPHCRTALDGATMVSEAGRWPHRRFEVSEDVMPEPGDLSICIKCGHLSIFDADLMLRDPTPAEQIKIAGDPRLVAIQKARGATRDK